MTSRWVFFLLGLFFSLSLTSQKNQPRTDFYDASPAAQKWVKKQFRRMSKNQRIAQLMIVRAHSNLGEAHVAEVKNLISEYKVGGLCFFQGGPVRQALLTNAYQALSKTPLLITIDAEWGLGMRLDSVIPFPRQMMMGAMRYPSAVKAFGQAVGTQLQRMGIQVNYAPVIDVNNNPLNPVINDRSFGENKYKVALWGKAYVEGMRAKGVMASGKHFPGHGDVAVDSHYDLPLINKSRAGLDSLELYPFKSLIVDGVGSMMVAHLYIPAIDTTANLATTLSYPNVTGLLKNELGFKGLTFTDALEMKGVTKFFPAGEASVQALIAGNDLLCLPGDVPGSIAKIRAAIKANQLSWDEINQRVKKVLLAKYNLGLSQFTPIDTAHLVEDLNKETLAIKKQISENSLTVLRLSHPVFEKGITGKKIAYVSLGAANNLVLQEKFKTEWGADIYQFAARPMVGQQVMDAGPQYVSADQADAKAAANLLAALREKKYDAIVLGVHNYSRRPANQFGLSPTLVDFLRSANDPNMLQVFFGNPYALGLANGCPNLVAAYEDDATTHQAFVDWLAGKIPAQGVLPVSIGTTFKEGAGLLQHQNLLSGEPEEQGLDAQKMLKTESILQDAIQQGAFPGAVLLVAKNGKIVWEKAYGHTDTTRQQRMQTDQVFDLASVTKISATTVAVMKLYQEGKIDLNKTLGDYLPWVKGTDKAPLGLKDILLHQAGLNPFIPFYRSLIDTTSGQPLPQYFQKNQGNGFDIRVAENIYLRNDYADSLLRRIVDSKLSPAGKYVYSDNDFIFLGKIVETVSGQALNEYVAQQFYAPLHMKSTGFLPRKIIPLDRIVPTERETHFRQQVLQGDVHDEGASLFGGVAGHAGLFSAAADLAKLYVMLLSGGTLDGQQIFSPATIETFTRYGSEVSRRGLGFDKPEKDNATRKDPYPSRSTPLSSFGHTGYTGTSVWADPDHQLLVILLTNRVHPTRNNNKISQLAVRSNIQEAIYQALR
ncbi:MAG: serine hydrolase [Sphingobacteriia bacterium]|nr:MAG: serine hydrolase [Sphingobacteriia bacterium]